MIRAETQRGTWWRVALIVTAIAVALFLIGWALKGFLKGDKTSKKKPPTISLLPDKPPPPPPPPKEEKRPEPPKAQQKEVKVEAPKAPEPQAQNEPLKMEGAAGEGPSPFGAGTVAKEYSGGPTGPSIGGGGAAPGAMMQHRLYVDRLQRHLQEELNRNRKLRESDYRVTLRVWLGRDGAVQRTELAQSTGNSTVDELLRQTLLQIAAMRDAPPANMPQPVRIRVTARGAG